MTLALASLWFSAFPRAKAAWRLHDQATALANYGVCMVGPTGPSTVTGDPEEFARLLRRRLLTQEADAQPFAECRVSFEEYVGLGTGAALEATAAAFADYGALTQSDDDVSRYQLVSLIPDVSLLEELSAQAWPFMRNGYSGLLKPSSHTREAAHPTGFPVPVYGSGLPHWEGLYRTAWREGSRLALAIGHGASLALFQSSTGGQDWSKASLASAGVGEHAGRCGSGNAVQSFLFEQDEGKIAVVSLVGDEPISRTTLRVSATPRSSSCDDSTAVFVAEPDAEPAPYVVLCQHAGRCGQLRVPAEFTTRPFDVAQISGVTVIASVNAGVVRVRSSRDRGKTWAPATIAIDAISAGIPLANAREVRMQPVEERLLLWLPQDNDEEVYPLVVSEDYGASFRGADASSVRRGSKPVASR